MRVLLCSENKGNHKKSINGMEKKLKSKDMNSTKKDIQTN